MSEETTSIQELPTTQNAPSNQVVVQQGHQQGGPPTVHQQGGPPTAHPPNELNNIIAGLQKAASNGATELPTRDRPMQTNQVMMDQNIKPDFVPEQSSIDYIKNYDTQQSQIQQLQQNTQRTLNISYIIDEYNYLLLLVFILYFSNALY